MPEVNGSSLRTIEFDYVPSQQVAVLIPDPEGDIVTEYGRFRIGPYTTDFIRRSRVQVIQEHYVDFGGKKGRVIGCIVRSLTEPEGNLYWLNGQALLEDFEGVRNVIQDEGKVVVGVRDDYELSIISQAEIIYVILKRSNVTRSDERIALSRYQKGEYNAEVLIRKIIEMHIALAEGADGSDLINLFQNAYPQDRVDWETAFFPDRQGVSFR